MYKQYPLHRDPHSFPTRRSSDLAHYQEAADLPPHRLKEIQRFFQDYKVLEGKTVDVEDIRGRAAAERAIRDAVRSEEHTSELQSRRDLVCRLLLEKKKIHNAVDA